MLCYMLHANATKPAELTYSQPVHQDDNMSFTAAAKKPSVSVDVR